ncbi:Dolichyl-diphosphooligosaccharide--protein glycosyltransferase subunit Swp1 [Lobosporangium transversale]|uniref:Ribophorin II n=1 Tax=Lobosporangium transversale TaxID=64571 RepID=A0A1Y2GDG2_9FUNG|nr:Dolichyl-diphosphooligosaccharide--protein glycosyltransferase subunit Swp1 [Lobosporangium transversale]ORZ07747.1 Dolichyl-diphosphooligosaccharide--protein glycosyltransferase subunit Swp1 [Lobosporangium transversale]|eukprot:XP_021878113.1 Dolichyl-diphosphooligosaccharide--protein glycosyltransferase subunit Swp1 [Lobosporangium transversale]
MVFRLEYPNTVENLTADSTDLLKFSFKIENSERPHQAMVVFQSQDEFQDEIMVAASVRSSGKGRFELNFAKADRKFKYGTRKYSMTFLLGGFTIDEPFKYTLGEIEVQAPTVNPATRPSRVEYKSQPEIHHQFRPDQKLINKAISGAFTLLVLTPFAALFIIWSQLGIKFEPLKSLVRKPLDLVAAIVFFASLIGIEYVFYSYWTHVTLFPVLRYLSVLSLVAIVSGRSVLTLVQARRLQRTAGSAKKQS